MLQIVKAQHKMWSQESWYKQTVPRNPGEATAEFPPKCSGMAAISAWAIVKASFTVR